MEKEMRPLSIMTKSLDALQPLLPVGATITVDERTRTLSLYIPSKLPRIEKFTFSEMRVLLALYTSYSRGCSTEYLLTQINTGSSLSSTRIRVQEARSRNTLTQELRPLREILKKIRLKLHPFGLTIATVHVAGAPLFDAGYQLTSLFLFEGE